MDETTWMGLALERKQALDSIKKIAAGLINDLHFLDEDEGILYNDFIDKLNRILSLSDEDSRW